MGYRSLELSLKFPSTWSLTQALCPRLRYSKRSEASPSLHMLASKNQACSVYTRLGTRGLIHWLSLWLSLPIYLLKGAICLLHAGGPENQQKDLSAQHFVPDSSSYSIHPSLQPHRGNPLG